MLKARVPEDTRVLANAAADALGVTVARYLELLIAADASVGPDRSLLANSPGTVRSPREVQSAA